MVLEEHTETELEPVEERPSTPFFVDEKWYDEHGLSYQDVVQARMCEACQSRAAAGEVTEEDYTDYDPKTRRAFRRKRQVPFASNPVRRIHDDCSKKKGFITPDMPTLEAVFRIYLANGNQPMPLNHVREQLVDWCPDGQCRWLLLSDAQLEQMVANDQFYGFKQFARPGEG
ncbi:MAG TPA: hypothetical protein VII06_21100 [Chloroflexota bacterium]|jgi:hypothetical protein